MQLPRRVPWSSIGELDQVCSWIFTDENDLDSKVLAVQRLTAWKTITSLPHAIDSTLALLVVILEERTPRATPGFFTSLRQNYAAALIRLVNGLVDPLQSGAYARSIASIAEQLGLPLWLVELRHSATHEELPSLELLQEGARQAMTWLFQNYWLPTISPYAAPTHNPTVRPLAPVLNEYKRLLKAITRDQSLKNTYQPSVTKVIREVERWVGEAKVAADIGLDASDPDFKESFALDRLAEELLQKGALVPLSKKKRVFPDDSFYPPALSVQVWSPILQQLNTIHPDLSTALVNRIINMLLDDSPSATGASSANSSFKACIARWASWIVDNQISNDPEAKRDIIISLITALGPKMSGSKPIAKQLLRTLCTGDTQYEAALSFLSSQDLQSSSWNTDDILVMTERLEELLGFTASDEVEENTGTPSSIAPSVAGSDFAPGWSLVDDTKWKACPMGVYA